MRKPTVFRVRHDDVAESTGSSPERIRQQLGDLSNHSLLSVLNFTALHAKDDVKIDIVIYACAREKTQVGKWRQAHLPSHPEDSIVSESDLQFRYEDLVEVTGLELNAIHQHKTRKVFDPRSLRSVLVELVARFAREDVKMGLVLRACANTKFPAFLNDAERRVKRLLKAAATKEKSPQKLVALSSRGE